MKSSRKQGSYKRRSKRHNRKRPSRSNRKMFRTDRSQSSKKAGQSRLPVDDDDTDKIPVASAKLPHQTKLSEKVLTVWWVHLWSGLVREPTGKHHKALKQAIWLYLYLLVAANWKHGTSFRRVPTIAAETGFNIRSIHRWLKILRKKGYITTTSNGRYLNFAVTKWRPISRKGKS